MGASGGYAGVSGGSAGVPGGSAGVWGGFSAAPHGVLGGFGGRVGVGGSAAWAKPLKSAAAGPCPASTACQTSHQLSCARAVPKKRAVLKSTAHF